MSKKKFSQRTKKEDLVKLEVKTEPAIDEPADTADKITEKDSDGVVIIDMGPRKHRDRYANSREKKDSQEVITLVSTENTKVEDEEKTEKNTNYSIDPTQIEPASQPTFLNIASEVKLKVNKLDNSIDTIQSQFTSALNEVRSEYTGMINVLEAIVKKSITDRDEKMYQLSNEIKNTYRFQNYLNDEIAARTNSEELLTNSIETLSEENRSISEGMDNYKSVHELAHSDLDSKIIKIYEFMDRIDPEPIEKAINKNASDLNTFSNYSNTAIDALIRIARMLGLSFIVLVIGFLAALLTNVIPVIFGKIVTGALVICCMGFILFEAKYIMKYINLASSTLKKIMLMISE